MKSSERILPFGIFLVQNPCVVVKFKNSFSKYQVVGYSLSLEIFAFPRKPVSGRRI